MEAAEPPAEAALPRTRQLDALGISLRSRALQEICVVMVGYYELATISAVGRMVTPLDGP